LTPALLARARLDGRESFGGVEGDRFEPLAGDDLTALRPAGEPVPLADVELLAPATPRAVLATMGGFVPPDGTPLPPGAEPWLFPKLASPIGGDGAVIRVPPFVESIWVEVELAIVIGKTARNASADEARDAILGYTIFNDATAPQFLFSDLATMTQATPFDIWRAKSLETFAAMGPWIRTDLSEADVAAGLRLTVKLNGELAGEGNTRNHKFPMSTWVRFASEHMTLLPGDVIALGTPCPCAAAPGDSVELEIEGIGTLRNLVASAIV